MFPKAQGTSPQDLGVFRSHESSLPGPRGNGAGSDSSETQEVMHNFHQQLEVRAWRGEEVLRGQTPAPRWEGAPESRPRSAPSPALRAQPGPGCSVSEQINKNVNEQKQQQLSLTQHLLYAKCPSQHFANTNSFNPRENFITSIIKDYESHNKNVIIPISQMRKPKQKGEITCPTPHSSESCQSCSRTLGPTSLPNCFPLDTCTLLGFNPTPSSSRSLTPTPMSHLQNPFLTDVAFFFF